MKSEDRILSEEKPRIASGLRWLSLSFDNSSGVVSQFFHPPLHQRIFFNEPHVRGYFGKSRAIWLKKFLDVFDNILSCTIELESIVIELEDMPRLWPLNRHQHIISRRWCFTYDEAGISPIRNEFFTFIL